MSGWACLLLSGLCVIVCDITCIPLCVKICMFVRVCAFDIINSFVDQQSSFKFRKL